MLSSNRIRETKLIQSEDRVQRMERELAEANVIIDRLKEDKKLV